MSELNDPTAVQEPSSLLEIIQSTKEDVRNISLDDYCQSKNREELYQECLELDTFRRFSTENLYQQVRALFFLHAIYRYHLPNHPTTTTTPTTTSDEIIPYKGYQAMLDRKFEDAIDLFLQFPHKHTYAMESSLAKCYYELGFQTLANQVKQSVQSHPGNAWMFTTSTHEYPLKWVVPTHQTLQECTPVRMDVSHCGWSDIFFLGMDYPQGARVLNISIDVSTIQQQSSSSPITCYVRTTPNAGTITLTSIDLKTSSVLTTVGEVFDFASDYLGLLKAGLVASGLIPPSYESMPNMPLSNILDQLGLPATHVGLELITQVHSAIPKGSRLAVSTNLLGSMIALLMRATGQISTLVGPLSDQDRRLAAARAILGEWLGGSGGGWQDSGGLWPGMKLIEGTSPIQGDAEYNISRGRLLPTHTLLPISPTLQQTLQKSLILVHGGMAQNVGPVLEMVTEKYLLRSKLEWKARQHSLELLKEMIRALEDVDMKRLAKLTTQNFFQPLQQMIPWITNAYTESLIKRIQDELKEDLLGFWMLGGCSGGGMGFLVEPEAKPTALKTIHEIMLKTKRELQHSLPFAMDPVVYDFSINHKGSISNLLLNETDIPTITTATNGTNNSSESSQPQQEQDVYALLDKIGFDRHHHEMIRKQLLSGMIGLEQNRLSIRTKLENVHPTEVVWGRDLYNHKLYVERGMQELQKGSIAVVTLAAGVGSRWTQGAGVVKALHPFCQFESKFRTFLDVHLSKTIPQKNIPHVITTSYMTHEPIQKYLNQNYPNDDNIYVSRGTNVGLRFVPTVKDLKFSFEQDHVQKLDVQAQKMKSSIQTSQLSWVQQVGEATDYHQPNARQCLHPIGHYSEVPSLFLNGTLKQLFIQQPQLQYLLLHNIDTVGVHIDPVLLGYFALSEKTCTFEVMERGMDDVGGGLAKLNGKQVRLVEGLAFSDHADEWKCSFYNTMTTWIHIDSLLELYHLTRTDILEDNMNKIQQECNRVSDLLPTYITIKHVKSRWGNGQEDVHPVAQYEQVWGDISSLTQSDFIVVPRKRGQQLKDPAQLDGWLRDGSHTYVNSLCSFSQ